MVRRDQVGGPTRGVEDRAVAEDLARRARPLQRSVAAGTPQRLTREGAGRHHEVDVSRRQRTIGRRHDQQHAEGFGLRRERHGERRGRTAAGVAQHLLTLEHPALEQVGREWRNRRIADDGRARLRQPDDGRLQLQASLERFADDARHLRWCGRAARQAGEVVDEPQARGGRGAGRGHGGLGVDAPRRDALGLVAQQPEAVAAHLHHVACLERGLAFDADAVEQRAIAAAEVDYVEASVHGLDPRVAPRDRRVRPGAERGQDVAAEGPPVAIERHRRLHPAAGLEPEERHQSSTKSTAEVSAAVPATPNITLAENARPSALSVSDRWSS